MIRELKQEGMTMVLATHEMSFAREVADQVCFLRTACIVEHGTPEQIFTAPAQAETQRFWRGCCGGSGLSRGGSVNRCFPTAPPPPT